MTTTTTASIEVKLAHTVHVRDHRTDSRCPLCRQFGTTAVPDRPATQDELEAAGLDTRFDTTGTDNGVTGAPITIVC